jgi:hypothetical protein
MEIAMRRSVHSRKVRRGRPEFYNHAEAAVATVWLLFYALALGAAGLSLLVSRAIELAAR